MLNRRGYIVLEALLSIVVLSLVVLAVFPMLSFLLKRSERSKYEAAASLLVQEGIEVAYNVFLDEDEWGLSNGDYHPSLNASRGEWVLLVGGEQDIETRFDRVVNVASVCRTSGTGEVIDPETYESCGGVVDYLSKWVTTRVSWEEGGETKSLEAKLMLLKV